MNETENIGAASKDCEINEYLRSHIDECRDEIEFSEHKITENLEQIEECQNMIKIFREDADTIKKTKSMYERMLNALERGGVI